MYLKKIGVAVVGLGNIGRAAAEAVRCADDLELLGIVRREKGSEDYGCPVVSDISELQGVQVALLCHPSRLVPKLAEDMAQLGIHTVDSFDIHSSIWDYVSAQEPVNKRTGTVSIVAAGWDPGTDSSIRVLLEAMAPAGVTHTNFGPGMSMGHSVAAKAVAGVKNALSITIPEGGGVHSRRVYIQVADGYDFAQVADAIKSDPYFVHDMTQVEQVADVASLVKTDHGVLLARDGASGIVEGQEFRFTMRIDNPALTGQIMVSCARAAAGLAPGCYTLPEIPPLALLPGSREELIKRMV